MIQRTVHRKNGIRLLKSLVAKSEPCDFGFMMICLLFCVHMCTLKCWYECVFYVGALVNVVHMGGRGLKFTYQAA